MEDRIQDLDTVNCGIFQIYFYHNLLSPNKNSKTQNKRKLNKKIIEILLHELFVSDNQQQNEWVIEQYTDERDLVMTWFTCSRADNYLFRYLFTFGRVRADSEIIQSTTEPMQKERKKWLNIQLSATFYSIKSICGLHVKNDRLQDDLAAVMSCQWHTTHTLHVMESFCFGA